jgi:hypothetical protein
MLNKLIFIEKINLSKMKRLNIIVSIAVFILFSYQCDRPNILDREAKLKIENTSTSNYITGVYYGTVGPGEKNKISSNIAPGESKTFTLDVDDDSVYDIKVTSNLTDYEEYTKDHYDFGWDDTYIIELTDDGWYTDSSW